MPRRARLAFSLAVGVCGALVFASAGASQGVVYPPTRVEPVVETLHGVEITDNYRWLEDGDSPEVKRWVEAQTALTRSLLDRFPERQQILERLKALYVKSPAEMPNPYRKRYFSWRRDPGQNQDVLYVRKGSYKAKRKLVLDPNTWSEDATASCDYTYINRDGSLLAYGRVESGNEMAVLHVLDVRTGKTLPDVIPNTRWCSLAWLPDKSGFYYTRYPDPGSVEPGEESYWVKVYLHTLGTDWHNDPVVFGEGRPRENLPDVWIAPDQRHVFFCETTDWIRDDTYVLDLKAPKPEIKPLAVGLDGTFAFTAVEGMYYFDTTWKAPHGCIYRCPAADPRPENWQIIVPEPEGVLTNWDIINRQLVVHLTENAHSRLLLYTLDGTFIKEIALPTVGTVDAVTGEWDGHEMFIKFNSYAYPPTVFRYDMRRGAMKVIDRLDLGVDLDQYETKQVWYTSKDGTRVPMFLVYKKGLVLDGNNPVELTGYGGFNASETPYFSRPLLVWLDAGGVYADANLRGGGEFGRAWHEAGRREHKQNVFDDFIAAAEYLIAEHYTNPQRLAITGASNGGLLVGAALTQRPDLFRAVICEVPLLDMLRYHLFGVGDIWSSEYGTADDPEQFKYLLAYSPYQNVKPGTAYPAVLFKTSEEDTRVSPAHARKMTALLQAASSSDPNVRPILLHVQPKTGHGGGRPLDMTLSLIADDYTWLMWQLGMIKPPEE